MTQAVLARMADVTRETWNRYESGALTPGSTVLAALARSGADVAYVLTGKSRESTPHSGGPIRGDTAASVLTAQERALVDNYRHASEEGRRALEATSSALAQSKTQLKPAA